MAPRPVELKLYHFTPILRSYVVLKNMNHSDVEGLFRVNALSTFSLGVAQMTCMLLGLSSGCLQLDVCLKFGALAQAMNIVVTIIYFATPVPETLMNLACIKAVEFATLEGVKEFFVRYEGAVQQHANLSSEDSRTVLVKFHDIADQEIRERTALPNIPLEHFSMARKMKLIAGLRMKSGEVYKFMNV